MSDFKSSLISSDNITQILNELRKQKHQKHKAHWLAKNLGEKVSDKVAEIVGSWPFIIIQALLIVFWIIINVIAWLKAWDPYPFILLNLILSFQAAFTAPVIMMSQNRQNHIDRKKAENDYNVNIKAELEIEELHRKIDLLREKEIKELIDIIRNMEKKLH